MKSSDTINILISYSTMSIEKDALWLSIQYRAVCVAIVANSKRINREIVFPKMEPEVQSMPGSWLSNCLVTIAVQTHRARFKVIRKTKLHRARCLTESFAWSKKYPTVKPPAMSPQGVTREQSALVRMLKYCVCRVPILIDKIRDWLERWTDAYRYKIRRTRK